MQRKSEQEEHMNKKDNNLSDRAVEAASVSIANKALKKKLDRIMEDEQ